MDLFLLPEEKEHGLNMSENYVLYGVCGGAERSVWSGHTVSRWAGTPAPAVLGP